MAMQLVASAYRDPSPAQLYKQVATAGDEPGTCMQVSPGPVKSFKRASRSPASAALTEVMGWGGRKTRRGEEDLDLPTLFSSIVHRHINTKEIHKAEIERTTGCTPRGCIFVDIYISTGDSAPLVFCPRPGILAWITCLCHMTITGPTRASQA